MGDLDNTPLVESESALTALCRGIVGEQWLALDTEFMRERTYFSQLCLIQVATSRDVACVDPLRLANIDTLLAALYERGTTKVIHSARQDLEIFFDLRGIVPGPVFDTQIAAALLGYDEQIGYGALVEAVTGVKLAKAHTRTDWAARPLSGEQLRYAAEDVFHLRDVYINLHERLREENRLAWLQEECRRLEDPALYRNTAETIGLRLKQGHVLGGRGQHVLRELIAWRETTARSRNLPRSWVLRDDDLVAIARAAPSRHEDLRKLLNASVDRAATDEILTVVATSRPGEDAPLLWEQPARFTRAQTDLLKSMATFVDTRARELKISSVVLAPRRDLKRLVSGRSDVAVLQGWRREIVGDDLLRML